MALTGNWDTLQLQTHGEGVLQVSLNRPDVGNAINTRMGQELLDLWQRLTEDAQGVRCVVLTGTGNKIFCAGGDLKERNGMTRAQWTQQHEIFERQSWALSISISKQWKRKIIFITKIFLFPLSIFAHPKYFISRILKFLIMIS